MYDIWYQQIEEIALHAQRWMMLSTICSWIGFGLSLIALAILIIRIKEESDA